MTVSSPRYHRTRDPIVAEVVPGGPLLLKLASFNHLNPGIAQYIMLFDLAQVPQDGERPLVEFTANPRGMVSYTPALNGRKFTKGLVVALSSTPVVLTKPIVPELTYQTEGVNA